MELSLLCVSWNVAGATFCYPSGDAGLKSFFLGTHCNRADAIADQIVPSLGYVDVIAVSTEDELNEATYLHSMYLPVMLGEYRNIARVKVDGGGEFSDAPAVVNLGADTALRLSIYVRSDLNVYLLDEPVTLTEFVKGIDQRLSGVSVLFQLENLKVNIAAVSLGSAGDRSTVEENKFVASLLRDLGRTDCRVLMGDFNTPPSDYVMSVPARYNAFSAPRGPRSTLTHDNVFIDPGRLVEAIEAVRFRDDTISNHTGLTAYIQLSEPTHSHIRDTPSSYEIREEDLDESSDPLEDYDSSESSTSDNQAEPELDSSETVVPGVYQYLSDLLEPITTFEEREELLRRLEERGPSSPPIDDRRRRQL
jgi:hypothetical protein